MFARICIQVKEGRMVDCFSTAITNRSGRPMEAALLIRDNDTPTTVCIDPCIFTDGFESGDTSAWSSMVQ
jgi:hypothetical protein